MTEEERRAIERHVERTIERKSTKAMRWLTMIGVPSILVLGSTLVVMLFTLPGLIEREVLSRIDSQRAVVERANNMALLADDSFKRIVSVRDAIMHDTATIEAIENLSQLSKQGEGNVLKFMTLAPAMNRSLSAQKYCVLHIPDQRRDLYAVPIASRPEVCVVMKERVYPAVASPNHAKIVVEYGCLQEGRFDIAANGQLLFDGCGMSKT